MGPPTHYTISVPNFKLLSHICTVSQKLLCLAYATLISTFYYYYLSTPQDNTNFANK